MPLKQVMKEHESSMVKAVEFLESEFKGLRSGRASTGLVDNIRVDYYGNMTPINQLAAVATPDATSIIIKPFDASCLKDVEKALKSSEVGLNPQVEGKAIRINVPPLSEDRRKQISGQIKQMGEQAKVSIRNIRRDANKKIDDLEKAKEITEDLRDKAKKDVDEITKKYTEQIEKETKAKMDEVMNS